MKRYTKKDFPVSDVRRFLEPGPVVLISSHWNGKDNIMTMGWHTVLEFGPSLAGLMISGGNHSFHMIKQSRECVINIPVYDQIDTIIQIGTTTGADTDKFTANGLTPLPSRIVKAPGIAECYAHFECRLKDDVLVDSYNFFIMEVVHASVATRPKYPQTVHYRGDGVFMVSGRQVRYPKRLAGM